LATQRTSVKQHRQPSDEDVVLMVNVSMLRQVLEAAVATAVKIMFALESIRFPADRFNPFAIL